MSLPPIRSVLLLLLLGLLGCSSLNVKQTDSQTIAFASETPAIQEIQQSTRNTTVQLKGKVGRQVPLLDGTVYELQDDTGSIWVLTKDLPPESGKDVVIQGTVRYQSILLNGKEAGSVFVEQLALQ